MFKKHSFTYDGSIDRVFPCRCQDKRPPITGIVVFWFSFIRVISMVFFTHKMSVLWSDADAVRSGSLFILFKVQTLKVTILTMFLHLSKLGLGSVTAFFKHWSQGSNLSKIYPFFIRVKGHSVLMYGLD